MLVQRLNRRSCVTLCMAIAIAIGALGVAGCRPRGCSRLVAEVAVPHGSGPLTRIDLITPDSMSGTNLPKLTRRNDDEDIYELSKLAFNYEEKRTLAAGLGDDITVAFELPAGKQAPSSFSAWTAPSYATGNEESGDANWQIMNNRARALQIEVPSVRARFRFEAYDCDD
jgi:hypothetical protein